MAVGDLNIKGALVLSGAMSIGDGTLVVNLNADKVDGAEKDIDGTFAGNSDDSIPTEKAARAYVDENSAEVAHKSDNETISGTWTFSAVPSLPDNTIETADIQDDAVTEDKIGNAFDSVQTENIAAGGGTWTIPAGIYMMAVRTHSTNLYLQMWTGSSWDGATASQNNWGGGLIISDGTNFRLYNPDGSNTAQIKYRKLS